MELKIVVLLPLKKILDVGGSMPAAGNDAVRKQSLGGALRSARRKVPMKKKA